MQRAAQCPELLSGDGAGSARPVPAAAVTAADPLRQRTPGYRRAWGAGLHPGARAPQPAAPDAAAPAPRAGCEHLCNDRGVSVDFNTADPLIRWDSYENLSADGEGASGVLGRPRVRAQTSCGRLGGCSARAPWVQSPFSPCCVSAQCWDLFRVPCPFRGDAGRQASARGQAPVCGSLCCPGLMATSSPGVCEPVTPKDSAGWRGGRGLPGMGRGPDLPGL